jgi:hypothetical protein
MASSKKSNTDDKTPRWDNMSHDEVVKLAKSQYETIKAKDDEIDKLKHHNISLTNDINNNEAVKKAQEEKDALEEKHRVALEQEREKHKKELEFKDSVIREREVELNSVRDDFTALAKVMQGTLDLALKTRQANDQRIESFNNQLKQYNLQKMGINPKQK